MAVRGAGNGKGSSYSIRVASRLTGLSSDTLRMWERRYGFPKPDRNSAGMRVYSQDHVERLMLVARTLKAGYRAGEVVNRSRDELAGLLASAASAGIRVRTGAPPVDSLMARLEADDVSGLLAELRQNVTLLGPKRFITEICTPLLERVGEGWATHTLEIRHEHLLTGLISTQLRMLQSAYEGLTREPVVLLATLPGEQHALGLEMAALYLALAGATPRWLGVDTPPDQIVEAARRTRAQVVGLSVSSSADVEAVSQDVGWLLRELPPDVRLWLGGRRARRVAASDPRLEHVSTWKDLDHALSRAR